MRQLLDADNSELRAILESLVATDTDISVREVARRHSQLKNASAFTRSQTRMGLIEGAQQRQRDARQIAGGHGKQPDTPPAGTGEDRTAEVKALEDQLQKLVAGHAGLIRAVQLAGGMGALERFWKDYKAVADEVHALGAVPKGGVVVSLPRASDPV